MRRLLLVLPLLLAASWHGQRAVAVWTSDLTLWTHAVAVAPSPRAITNWHKAHFVETGRWN